MTQIGADRFYVLDTVVAYRARSSQTGNAYMAFEAWVAPNCAVRPLHQHAASELFLTLEGEMQYLLLDRSGLTRIEGGAGTVAFVPGSVAHTYRNETSAPARYLAVVSPGDRLELFFNSVRRQIGPQGQPIGQIDPDQIARARARAGITWIPLNSNL